MSSISFNNIRHNDAEAYMDAGYGGKPLEAWPVFGFFTQYLSGDVAGAVAGYEEWYYNQLRAYASVPKKKGGMYQGSLYRLIQRETGKPFEEVADEEKRRVITLRVKQRFKLLVRIVGEGYDPQKGDRIEAVRKGSYVYLKGGHHRAAILLALGEKELPNVFVFPHPLVYAVYTTLRNLKYGRI